MEKQIEKDKYIIYNEDNKVLIFTSTSSRKTEKILLPSISKFDSEDKQDFYDSVKRLLVEDECYLGQDISFEMIYETNNRKLQKQSLQIIRNYYSCYKQMKEKDYEVLIKMCYKNDVLPYFITIEALKQLVIKRLILDKYYEYTSLHSSQDEYYIDTAMYGSLEELQKRLSFEKF